MAFFGRRGTGLPPQVAAELGLDRGDRVLAWATDTNTGAYVVASMYAVHQVPAAEDADEVSAAVRTCVASRWSRPWLDVAAGAWEPTTRTLTATWADGGRPAMWTVAPDQLTFPSVFHERVNASVYVSVPVQMGEKDAGRVALRKDLSDGRLVEQRSLRRGAGSDPEVQRYADELLASLKEQAGL